MPSTAGARTSVARAIFQEIRSFCESHANPDRARRYARYFTEGYDAWGVDHRLPEWEANRKRWSDRLRSAGSVALTESGRLLTRTGKYEEASFAILCAQDLHDFYTPELFASFGEWFDDGIRNWAHTDVFCKYVLCEFLLRRIVMLDALRPWRESPHKYQRRAVPVTMIEAIGALDLDPWLTFIEPLMSDNERVVHQGTGWFLREAWKKRPKPVEAFLLRHKDTAPRLIYQYATEKMDKQRKERFRRTR
jgi:3-methyladenine DNA glycosylase AlkD